MKRTDDMRKMFSSLRARVLLLIAIPFAVMLSLTAYHALSEREERLTNARTRVVDTARIMVGEQRRNIEHVHQVLSSAALLPEVRGGVASDDCNRALAALHKREPNLNTILLALTNGDVICNAIPTARYSIADRDFFKAAIQTRQFSEGGFVISRTTGKPGIGFAYPVLDGAGVPRNVVATTLDLGWLSRELAKAQLPEGARVVVVDGEGLVLGRYPDPEGWVGKSAAELPLLKSILATGGEGTEEEMGLDGLRRIFGFVPLQRTASGQSYLWVAIPKAIVVGPAEREFVVGLVGESALLVLTFWAVWLGSQPLFVRRIVALTDAAKEMGKGNLETRVGARASDDEIGQLARSFDEMAEGLQTKETQRSRAVRALRVLSVCNRAMLQAKQGEQLLLEAICRAIGEAGGYRMAWIGYAENDTERSIRSVAHWGSVAERYFENVKLTWSETESGRTPPGRAIRTGMPVVVHNVQRETGPQPWQAYTLRCGCRSCLALPLRIDDRVIGVLDVCAEEVDAFSDEEVSLLSEAAADLSFGIARQRAEVEHARVKAALMTAEERIAAAAEASMDALLILKSVRDPAGNIADLEFAHINARAEELFGMERERVIGQKLCELLPFNRTGGFFDKYAQVLATGTPLEQEFPIDTPEIKAKWLRQQVVRVDDGIAISARDITAWKAAGAQLRDSEETLKAITASAQDAVLMLDNDGNIVLWNAAAQKLFGYSNEEALGKNLHLLLAPSRFQEAYQTGFHHFSLTGEGVAIGKTLELAALRKDGTEFPIELSLSAVKIKDKWHGVGIVRDITERKRAETALRESEQNYRSLADSGMALIWTSSTDKLCNYFNRPWLQFTGRTLEQELGNGWAEGVHPDDLAQCLANYTEAFDRREPFSLEYRLRRHDGEFRWVRDDGCPRYDSKGEFIGYLGYVMDITESKRAEEAHRVAALYARNLIEASLDPLVTISPAGKITDVNKATEEVTGLARDRLVGTDFADYFTAPEKARASYQQVLAEGYVRDYPLTIRHASGRTTDVLYNGTVYRNEAGELQGVFAAARDITERKRAQDALAQSEQKYRTIFEESLDCLFVTSPGGKILDMNKKGVAMFGFDSKEEILRLDLERDVYAHPADRKRILAMVNAQGSAEYEVEVKKRSGGTMLTQCALTAVKDETGAVVSFRGILRDITEKKQTERALKTLSACNEALVRATGESELLDAICRLIVGTGGYRMAWVGYAEQGAQKSVRPAAQYGHENGYLESMQFSWADTELGRGPTGTAIRTGSVQINRNFLTDLALAPWREAAQKRGYKSSIALPLKSAAGMLGALTIDAAELDAFNEAEVKLLQELADDLAFGIETLRTRAERDRNAHEHLHHEAILRQSLEDSVKAIANTVEMRDPYTAGHQRRVGELATAISKELGLPDETTHGILLASSIHDLGKIRVPAEILSKPVKLTGTEFILVQGHAQAGYDILKDIKFPWPIATLVLQHHERLDGSGYPERLKGDQIQLGARILAVADVVEAMASHRPYRPAIGVDAALAEIEKGRGIAFDAAVVDACLKLFRGGRFALQA